MRGKNVYALAGAFVAFRSDRIVLIRCVSDTEGARTFTTVRFLRNLPPVLAPFVIGSGFEVQKPEAGLLARGLVYF